MRNRWWALAALCFAELLVMVDNTIVNVALPTMARDLNAGISGLQWIVDAYTLVFAGLLLTGGYLGDRFGHRRMLVTGIVGFTAVSVLAALSQSLGQLITARAVLGLFAALVFPATLAIITVVFPQGTLRAAAIGIWAATSGIAVAIGPVLGGWLLEHYSWSSVFWINLPVGVVAVTTILLVVPGTRPDAVNRFDFVGLALSIIGRPRRADLLGHRGPTLRVEQRPHHRRHRRGRARPRAVRPPPTRRRLPDPRRAPV